MNRIAPLAILLSLPLACSNSDSPPPRTIDPESVKDIDVEDVLALLSTPGDRPVVVNFWGSWCPPCVRELPDLAQAAVDHPHVRFVGVGVEKIREREKARAANAKLAGHAGVGYELRLSTAPPEILFRALEQSASFPTTFVVPRNGVKPTVYVGAIEGVRLAEFRELLGSLK